MAGVCPKCGENEVYVKAVRVVECRVSFDPIGEDLEVIDVDEAGDNEFDGDSSASCTSCDWTGKVGQLRKPVSCYDADEKAAVLWAIKEFIPKFGTEQTVDPDLVFGQLIDLYVALGGRFDD